MRTACLASLCFLLLGCPTDEPPDPGDEPISGGTIQLQACGYGVTTRDGASAPRPGPDRLGPDPTPRSVHLGLAGDPARTIDVVWRTKDDLTPSTKVQFGEGEQLDQALDGFTFFYETPNQPSVRIHEAHLCGLKPDTRYSYRVGGVEGDRQAWSPTYHFRTAPDLKASPAAQVVIALLGDTRGGHAYWGQMLKQVQALGPPDLILFSGDAVILGTLQSEWEEYFSQAEDVLSSIPLLGAHGNHDLNAVNYFSQFAFPGSEDYYGLDYGAAHLTVLNDTPLDPAEYAGRAVQFLEEELKTAAPWKLTMHHKPLWSASVGHGGDQQLQQLWGPLLDKYKVDLDLSGHEHNYERTKPMRGPVPQVNLSDGTTFVVSGSAGAELYQNGTGFWTEKSEMTRSFVLLKVRKGVLEMKAYRDDGTVIDSMTVMKR